MLNPRRWREVGRPNAPGVICARCGVPLSPAVKLYKQDGVEVCNRCLRAHDEKTWDAMNVPDVDTPLRVTVGGRTR
jgi:hypothetical protein